jgi:hypothetical protein
MNVINKLETLLFATVTMMVASGTVAMCLLDALSAS